MKPDEFARSYFDSLTIKRPPAPSPPIASVATQLLVNQKMPKAPRAWSDGIIDPLSMGDWIEVIGGVYLGEIAEVTKLEKEIGMIQANVVPWSLRSILNARQFETITQKESSFIYLSKEAVQAWSLDPKVVVKSKTLRSIAVHQKNIKTVSSQLVRVHKEETDAVSKLKVGLLVRLRNPSNQGEEDQKKRYVILRFFQGGYVLLGKKKLVEDNNHGGAKLVKNILLDKDFPHEETVFVPDFEEASVTPHEICPTLDVARIESSDFVLAHFNELLPTAGKKGEKVLILEGRLTDESKIIIAQSLHRKVELLDSSFSLCAEIIEKDRSTGCINLKLSKEQGSSLYGATIKLRSHEVCSFITFTH